MRRIKNAVGVSWSGRGRNAALGLEEVEATQPSRESEPIICYEQVAPVEYSGCGVPPVKPKHGASEQTPRCWQGRKDSAYGL